MSKRGTAIELNLGELPSLPARWKWGRVEDAAAEQRNAIVDGPFGSNLKLSDYIAPPGVPVLTTANLRGDYSPDSVRYISQPKFEELKRSEVRGGDILMAKIGSCGLTGVYPEDMPSAIIPANLLKMTVHPEFIRKFVLYYLNSPAFAGFLKAIITATAQPAFNVSKFRQLPLPLVPKDEQRRIVAEIEKQFTRLEAGVAALRRVQANLKRYRAAVLKAACEGKLVPTEAELQKSAGKGQKGFESGEQLLKRILAERRQHWTGRGQYKEPAAPDTANLPTNLPEGWACASVDQITENFDGRRVPLKSADRTLRSGEYPYYGASGIIDDIDDFLFDGDYLLVAEDGANLLSRSTPIAFKATGKFWVNNHAHIVQTRGGIPLAYLSIFLNGKDISFSVTGSAQPKLTQAALNKIPVPLPPLAEQTRIVAEVERRLSVVEELESVVSANLQRASRLRQSILQKAFTGELA